jgi:hypothetical protein
MPLVKNLEHTFLKGKLVVQIVNDSIIWAIDVGNICIQSLVHGEWKDGVL